MDILKLLPNQQSSTANFFELCKKRTTRIGRIYLLTLWICWSSSIRKVNHFPRWSVITLYWAHFPSQFRLMASSERSWSSRPTGVSGWRKKRKEKRSNGRKHSQFSLIDTLWSSTFFLEEYISFYIYSQHQWKDSCVAVSLLRLFSANYTFTTILLSLIWNIIKH